MSEVSQPRQQRSYAAQVIREVLLQWGARLGLIWIGVLVLVAVFASFLANSHPLLLSERGQVSSPLLHHLSAVDVTLLIVFLSVVVLYFARLGFRTKFGITLLVALLAGTICYALIAPPQLTIYEQYREKQQQGVYDWMVMPPIPYSAKDYLRDRGDTGLEAPLAADARTHWFGTDENGADVLSRMIHASRIALAIGFVATGIAMVIGTVIGGLMGYFSGIYDMIGMRLVEIFEAIPVSVPAADLRRLFRPQSLRDDDYHRDHRMDRLRALRARRVSEAAPAGVRPVRGGLRPAAAFDPVSPRAAQRHGAGAGGGLVRRGLGDPGGGDAELPRPRPGGRPLLGADAQPGGAGRRPSTGGWRPSPAAPSF